VTIEKLSVGIVWLQCSGTQVPSTDSVPYRTWVEAYLKTIKKRSGGAVSPQTINMGRQCF
jgi:hypothetical protein